MVRRGSDFQLKVDLFDISRLKGDPPPLGDFESRSRYGDRVIARIQEGHAPASLSISGCFLFNSCILGNNQYARARDDRALRVSDLAVQRASCLLSPARGHTRMTDDGRQRQKKGSASPCTPPWSEYKCRIECVPKSSGLERAARTSAVHNLLPRSKCSTAA